jgi:superfamily II DNA/RNA helicase
LQYVLFSATINEATLLNIQTFVNNPIPKAFQVSKEAIRLVNVKQFKMNANDKKKINFLKKFYTELKQS